MPRTSLDAADSGIVADGYERLVSGVESEARRVVEAKYANEWNSSGLIRRWHLQRKIDADVATLVAKMMPDVSPESMF